MSHCNTTSTSILVAHDCRTWHVDDQTRWLDLFDPCRSWNDHIWVRQTQYQNAGVYTRYLGSLARSGCISPRFITPRGLQHFIRSAESDKCRARTISGYAWALYKMAVLLWPDRDWNWLMHSCKALQNAADRTAKKKLTRIPDAGELLYLADALIAQSRARPRRDWQATELFRTGLYIHIGIHVPERLRALAHLSFAWIDLASELINFPAEAIKSKTERAWQIPPDTSTLIGEWATEWRKPWISRHKSGKSTARCSHNSFWIAKGGGPATDAALTASLRKMTQPYFGHPITSHRFRDAAATLQIERAPQDARLAQQTLGHRRAETLREYVETANQIAASRFFSDAQSAMEDEVIRRIREGSRATPALNPRSRRRRRAAV